MKSKAAVRRIVEELKVLYPNARCSLEYKKDYELLFAVRLSAQCTDARVNMVTPSLYQKFPTLEAFANATYEEVGDAIRSCGFYNTKSKDIVECAKILLEKYGGKVPGTMEELTALPGIGRKTANLILGDVYGQPAYVCDTHCIRITGRLGLTDGSKDPLSVEKQLRAILPPEKSNDFCHRLVLFGRDRCTARKANCDGCPLRKRLRLRQGAEIISSKSGFAAFRRPRCAPCPPPIWQLDTRSARCFSPRTRRGEKRSDFISCLRARNSARLSPIGERFRTAMLCGTFLVFLSVVEFAWQDVLCRARCIAVAALDGHVDRLLAALIAAHSRRRPRRTCP